MITAKQALVPFGLEHIAFRATIEIFLSLSLVDATEFSTLIRVSGRTREECQRLFSTRGAIAGIQ
jgi:hypothetical protein